MALCSRLVTARRNSAGLDLRIRIAFHAHTDVGLVRGDLEELSSLLTSSATETDSSRIARSPWSARARNSISLTMARGVQVR